MPAVCWKELLRAVESGNSQADAELYEEYCRVVWPQLIRRLGIDRAEDALHDGFLKLLRVMRRGSIRAQRIEWTQQAVYRYLHQLARNLVQDALGAQRPHVSLAVCMELPDGRRSPEQLAIIGNLAEIARGAMTAEEWEATLRSDSDAELARRLETSPGNVRLIRFKGKQKAGLALIGRAA